MKNYFFLLLLLPLVAPAQKNYVPLLKNHVQAEFSVKEFNGAVLVVHKGKTIYQEAVGLADREWDVKNTVDTRFRIGSITKQFTAACILQLAESGKLNLEDRLSRYIPDYPKGDSITIHMLLNHTSGIKNYTDIESIWPKAPLPLTTDSMIAIFKHEPLDFSPGTKWNYSNSGYFLLGVIVEKVSGQTFSEYLMQHVIQKAGLKNTAMDRLDTVLQWRAKGYSRSRTRVWEHALYLAMEIPYSAGAMISTVNDLYTWTKSLHSGKIMKPVSLEKMLTPYKDNYGYGILIDSFKSHKRIWHNGGIPGFSAHLAYYPVDDLCVVVISNNEISSDRIAFALASIMFDINVPLPYQPKAITLPPAMLDKFIGSFSGSGTFTIYRKGTQLFRHRDGTSDIELKPESETRLFYADNSDRFIEFQFDKHGIFMNAWLVSGTDRISIKKLDSDK